MIVDNADDHEVLLSNTNIGSKSTRLSDHLLRSDRGAILFTTRGRKVAAALAPNSVLRLIDMSMGEARKLLRQRTTEQALCSDVMAIDELLEAFTCLPLAIVQAAAFMSTNYVSMCGYLALFRDTDAQAELFNEGFASPGRYEELNSTIAKTWHISFDQIRKQDLLAAEYLSFMACIDRVNFPQSLLPLEPSTVQQTRALGTLTGYAFITERLQTAEESGRDRHFDMHRLVHMASACCPDAYGQRAAWVNAVVTRLEQLVPYARHVNKEIWTTYLPHAIHVAELYNIADRAAGTALLDRVGRCQVSLGQRSPAETTHQQVLLVRTKVLVPEDPDTLTSINEAAQALSRQGKYVTAEKMRRDTLKRREKLLGKKHPKTLMSMNNVAQAVGSRGEYIAAEKMYRDTLEIRQKVLGEEHPHRLASIDSLAYVLANQPRYDESDDLSKQSCAAHDAILGGGSSTTRTCHEDYR